MTLNTSAKMRRAARLLVLCALVMGTAEACLYKRGRIRVYDGTAKIWNAGEDEARQSGKLLIPVGDSGKVDSLVPPDSIARAVKPVLPSLRHGAGDKRLLSLRDDRGQAISSGIVAEIILVKGSEYKSEKEFEKGWLPVAIVYRARAEGRPESADLPYAQLGLPPADTSWVFVRKPTRLTWQAALVSHEKDKFTQHALKMYTPKVDALHPEIANTLEVDALEPVIGARFVWDGKDETMWAYCGGKCCQMKK